LRLLESAFQQAKDSIIITTANPDHHSSEIVFVNPAFSKMTGYSEEEIIDDPSIILQGPDVDGAEWLKLESSQRMGKAFNIETVNYRKDGTKISLEWQIFPIKNEKGKITHFVSIHRDISERKRAEGRVTAYQRQLRSLASELSLAEEKERRRIATMLHDHIGQTLAMAKIKSGALRDSLSSEGYKKDIDEIRTLLEKSIQYSKSLTFELSPPILYELGLEMAIEWLGEEMQKQYNILFEFEDDGKPKPLDRDVSVLMFQAVRELFMNVIKHSRAGKVKTSIRRYNTRIRIKVKDDGVGFDSSKVDKVKTFGFFSIHERLRHFGGTFVIDTGPGRGTRIILTAPLQERGLK
jgi:PAS domain S-box-containing protein